MVEPKYASTQFMRNPPTVEGLDGATSGSEPERIVKKKETTTFKGKEKTEDQGNGEPKSKKPRGPPRS